MANLWKVAREWLNKRNPHRNITPSKLSAVLEILKTQEEAKDHVYYDALKRISATKVRQLTCFLCYNFPLLFRRKMWLSFVYEARRQSTPVYKVQPILLDRQVFVNNPPVIKV